MVLIWPLWYRNLDGGVQRHAPLVDETSLTIRKADIAAV
jgi:hypothetical protein